MAKVKIMMHALNQFYCFACFSTFYCCSPYIATHTKFLVFSYTCLCTFIYVINSLVAKIAVFCTRKITASLVLKLLLAGYQCIEAQPVVQFECSLFTIHQQLFNYITMHYCLYTAIFSSILQLIYCPFFYKAIKLFFIKRNHANFVVILLVSCNEAFGCITSID